MEDNKNLEKMEEISDDELDEVTGGLVTGIIGGQPVLVQPGHLTAPGVVDQKSKSKDPKKRGAVMSKRDDGTRLS